MKKALHLALIATNVFAVTESQPIYSSNTLDKDSLLIDVRLILVKNNSSTDWISPQGHSILPTTKAFILPPFTESHNLSKLPNTAKLIMKASIPTRNGESVPINNEVQTAYTSSFSKTNESNYTIKSDLVSSGVRLIIKPVISGNKITLATSYSMQLLTALTNFTSDGMTIQLPQISSCALSQQAILKSGETLVLEACSVNYEHFTEQFTGNQKESGSLSESLSENKDAQIYYLATPTIIRR